MPLTIGQLIAKMSYPGLNNYARSIDWNNAPEALVVAVWQRYEVLIDSLDGTEAPFATPDFWNRMLGEEALEIEAQAQVGDGKPESERCVSDSCDNNSIPATAPDSPSVDDIDVSEMAEEQEFIEEDAEGNAQIAPGPQDNIQMLPVDETSDRGADTADPTPTVSPRSQSPLPGPSHRPPQPVNDQIGGALEDNIDVREVENIFVRRFGTRAQGYEITFRNLDAIDNLHALLQRAIELAVQRTTRDARPNDLIGVQITAPGMRKPVLLPFRPKEQIDVEKIMHLLDSVAQSNTNVKVDENMTIRVTRVCPPRAGGKKKAPPFKSNMSAHLESFERAVVKIENTDMLCIPRAIVTGMAYEERNESPQKMNAYRATRAGDERGYTRQRREAEALAQRAGIDPNQQCGLPEFELLQRTIPDRYRLSIWDAKLLVQVFSGPQPRLSTIYIMITNEHSYWVQSMPAVLGKSYFCDQCERGYDSKDRHNCPAVCACKF